MSTVEIRTENLRRELYSFQHRLRLAESRKSIRDRENKINELANA